MSELTWLDLSDTILDDERLAKIASQCQALKTLIAKRCHKVQGAGPLVIFPSVTELVLDESGLVTLLKLKASKLEHFRANHCKHLKEVELLTNLSALRKWEMVGAISLGSLKLKAPNLQSLHLSECSTIQNIETGSTALSTLDIQGCRLLNTVGLASVVLAEGQTPLRQVTVSGTIFPTIVQCCPSALYFRYHPPQNRLFNQIEVAYYRLLQNGSVEHSQQLKHNIFTFLQKFDQRVCDIFEKEPLQKIMELLRQLNCIGQQQQQQQQQQEQSVLNQLKVALKDKNRKVSEKAEAILGSLRRLPLLKTVGNDDKMSAISTNTSQDSDSKESLRFETNEELMEKDFIAEHGFAKDDIWKCAEFLALEDAIKQCQQQQLKMATYTHTKKKYTYISCDDDEKKKIEKGQLDAENGEKEDNEGMSHPTLLLSGDVTKGGDTADLPLQVQVQVQGNDEVLEEILSTCFDTDGIGKSEDTNEKLNSNISLSKKEILWSVLLAEYYYTHKKKESNTHQKNMTAQIEKHKLLQHYYGMVITILHNTFCAARMVHGRDDKSAHMYVPDVVDSTLLAPLSRTCASGTIEGAYNRVQASKCRALATFFANPIEQCLMIEALARYVTLAQESHILELPSTLLEKIKMVGTQSDTSDETYAIVISRKAQYDCEKLILAIENGKITLNSKRNIQPLSSAILSDLPGASSNRDAKKS
ncbi:hypothetical protein RFI_22220 [Reticulomyxa filosa]|uniref:Uncharacterized protein n=1 Tax=Reticulomyxa filosa TaxID=46433 RepID=X6MMA0_RETFI|nr:hypothetical protein RFI_22220 [Reticulomyxa filosa]|eukprot:ETO15143.1 hypothetical protein RFI_22220 [Reticulomyxa filosa]